jgi:hypothetical protein
VALAGAVALLAFGPACSSSGARASTIPSNVKADAHTRVIAEVEFRRQCMIGQQSFPQEIDITKDLDGRLGAVGINHLTWKNWHDELATSPELVKQFAELSKAGCG